MSKGETRWGYSDSEDTERWEGAFKTRSEAIEAAREAYGEVAIYVVSGSRVDPSSFVPDADEIIEIMDQRADDEIGEAAEEGFDVSEQSKLSLNELLVAWAKGLNPPLFWQADGSAECVDWKPKKVPARRKLRKPGVPKYRKGMYLLQRLKGEGNGDVIAARVESNPKGSEKVILINSLDPTGRSFLRDPKVLAQRTMVVAKKYHDRVLRRHLTSGKAAARELAVQLTQALSTEEQGQLFASP